MTLYLIKPLRKARLCVGGLPLPGEGRKGGRTDQNHSFPSQFTLHLVYGSMEEHHPQTFLVHFHLFLNSIATLFLIIMFTQSLHNENNH